MRQRLFDQCRWVKNASASSLLRSNEYRWEHNCTVSGILGTSLSASHLGLVLCLLGATFSQESVIGRRRVIAPESASTGPNRLASADIQVAPLIVLIKRIQTVPQPASLNPFNLLTRSQFIAAACDTRHLRGKKSSHPPGDRKPPVRRLVSDPVAAGYPPVLRDCSHCCLTASGVIHLTNCSPVGGVQWRRSVMADFDVATSDRNIQDMDDGLSNGIPGDDSAAIGAVDVTKPAADPMTMSGVFSRDLDLEYEGEESVSSANPPSSDAFVGCGMADSFMLQQDESTASSEQPDTFGGCGMTDSFVQLANGSNLMGAEEGNLAEEGVLIDFGQTPPQASTLLPSARVHVQEEGYSRNGDFGGVSGDEEEGEEGAGLPEERLVMTDYDPGHIALTAASTNPFCMEEPERLETIAVTHHAMAAGIDLLLQNAPPPSEPFSASEEEEEEEEEEDEDSSRFTGEQPASDAAGPELASPDDMESRFSEQQPGAVLMREEGEVGQTGDREEEGGDLSESTEASEREVGGMETGMDGGSEVAPADSYSGADTVNLHHDQGETEGLAVGSASEADDAYSPGEESAAAPAASPSMEGHAPSQCEAGTADNAGVSNAGAGVPSIAAESVANAVASTGALEPVPAVAETKGTPVKKAEQKVQVKASASPKTTKQTAPKQKPAAPSPPKSPKKAPSQASKSSVPVKTTAPTTPAAKARPTSMAAPSTPRPASARTPKKEETTAKTAPAPRPKTAPSTRPTKDAAHGGADQALKKPNGAPSQSAADKKTPSAATAQRTPLSKSTPSKTLPAASTTATSTTTATKPAASKAAGSVSPASSASGSASSPRKVEAKSKIGSLDNSTHTPSGGNVKIVSKKMDVSTVQSKIGSKDNMDHKPGGGVVKIETKKVKVEGVKSKIGSLDNAKHTPGGGDKKIEIKKLEWNVSSRVGSLDNAHHVPGGGDKKIENKKLDWKAQSKVGSMDNAKHTPGGGDKKIETRKIDWNVQSKVGSLENASHSPGGGDKKIETRKTEWKAQARIGSLNNAPQSPRGENKKGEKQDKSASEDGSVNSASHTPGDEAKEIELGTPDADSGKAAA